MKGRKRLNLVMFILAVVFLVLWAWWLFRPQPMLFVLKARWNVHGRVLDIALSPQNDRLAAFIKDWDWEFSQLILTVNIWKITKPQTQPQTITVSKGFVQGFTIHHLAFSPDGRFLAVSYQEQNLNKVALFSVVDGRKLRTVTMGMSKRMLPPTVSFAPDGRLVVSHDGQLWFVQVDDGKKTQTTIQADDVIFSPDGQWIVAVRFPTSVIGIYSADGRLVRQIHVPADYIVDATFSKDGQHFVCLWLSRQPPPHDPNLRWKVSIWQTSGWIFKQSKPFTPFQSLFSSSSATFVPDISFVALSEPDLTGWDGLLWRLERFAHKLLKRPYLKSPPTQVVMRRLSNGQIVAKLPRFGRTISDCTFSSDGHYLAVAHDDTIVLWEPKGKK